VTGAGIVKIKGLISIVSCVIVLALAGVYVAFLRSDPPAPRPTIILISVDTLRPDHLGCYGYSRNTSPAIDHFAKGALLFENCLSHAPVTSSSCASILSGFLPHETKVFENGPLPSEVTTLPEILQQQGYKTVAVVSNYVLRKKRGWEQGFELFDDTMTNREMVRNYPERIAEHTTDRAIKYLNQFNDDQLFLWVHYQDPHGPYTAPDSFAGLFIDPNQTPRNLKLNKNVSGLGGIPAYQKLGAHKDYHYYLSQYDSEIRYLDEHFSKLIDALKKLGNYDNSLIVFTADHGEGMGENNYYFAHGDYLYNSQIRVPLIIKYGKELSGRKVDYVQHIDIVPTIVRILGIQADLAFRGSDLRQHHETHKEIFSEMFLTRNDINRLSFSIVNDGLKFIVSYTPSFSRKNELFDLKSDVREEHNLANHGGYQQRMEALKSRLNRICGEDLLQLGIVSEIEELTDEDRDKLRSLGYVD
jgi:arylsulfatase